jgi:hypothetical protein
MCRPSDPQNQHPRSCLIPSGVFVWSPERIRQLSITFLAIRSKTAAIIPLSPTIYVILLQKMTNFKNLIFTIATVEAAAMLPVTDGRQVAKDRIELMVRNADSLPVDHKESVLKVADKLRELLDLTGLGVLPTFNALVEKYLIDHQATLSAIKAKVAEIDENLQIMRVDLFDEVDEYERKKLKDEIAFWEEHIARFAPPVEDLE